MVCIFTFVPMRDRTVFEYLFAGHATMTAGKQVPSPGQNYIEKYRNIHRQATESEELHEKHFCTLYFALLIQKFALFRFINPTNNFSFRCYNSTLLLCLHISTNS